MNRLSLAITAVMFAAVALQQAELDVLDADGQAIEKAFKTVRQESDAKTDQVTALMAGRLTLAEVTDQFQKSFEERPEYLADVRRQHAGATDREKVARSVVVRLELLLTAPADSDEQERVRKRLADEFDVMFPTTRR